MVSQGTEKIRLKDVFANLRALYGDRFTIEVQNRLQSIIAKYQYLADAQRMEPISQRDAILISYADQVRQEGSDPLTTLHNFCHRWLSGIATGIHLLPFYPSSSDDGFSVIDYRSVDREVGRWQDTVDLAGNFRLMFDAVINHVSVKSAWFKGFLRDDPRFKDYFIVVQGNPDLSQVVRPRALPLLTLFETSSGEKQVWTTFSTDQVDLNYHNPDLLLDVIEILMFYVSQGAGLIRLDAIAYLWKEIGTTCIHLPQTHRVIQFIRSVIDLVAPYVLLVTETNVPHKENLSYFGDGHNEAHMVYNFALPPLVLYTLWTGDARYLREWASDLTLPSNQVTFLNFLASHDGIGINSVRGILPEEGIELLINKTLEHGGFISQKSNSDGSKSPYELNINYFDALINPGDHDPLAIQVDRFMAAHAIMLALVGVPGIYFHSLFGSRGWPEGVQLTGRYRTVNRQKFDLAGLEGEMTDLASRRYQVYQKFRKLLVARAGCSAFHPFGDQLILNCGDSIFSLVRYSPDHDKKVLCLQNVTDHPSLITIDQGEVVSINKSHAQGLDLINGRTISLDKKKTLILDPYQTLWLDFSIRE